jgi:putative ABC transport system permease protein
MRNQPPRFGRWLLRLICSDEHFDEVSGDLEEIYQDRLQTLGKLIASTLYIRDAILSIRNVRLFRINRAMTANLVTIAVRSLKKRLSYSLLNIGGLAASIAFAFLAWMYVQEETSYDKDVALADRIYRVNLETDMGGKVDVYSNVPTPVLPALKSSYPQIEEGARVGLTGHIGTLEYKEKKSRSVNFVIADPPVLKLFDKEFIEGNPSKALVEPASVIISRSMAESIFGSINVVGKVVYFIEFEKELKITGVIEDDLRRSHFPMDVIVPWSTFKGFDSEKWHGFHTYAYILLNKENDIGALQRQMPAFFDRYMKKTYDEFSGKGKIFFQPIREIHLANELLWEPNPHGSGANILALSFVALLLIVFAVINYVNLATAQAAERAGEVSIRKIMGSSRQLLWAQFLSESVLLATSAGVLAFALVWMMFPYFNQLTGLEISSYQFFASDNVRSIFLLSTGIGLIAGIFPAFYLSSSPAVNSLRGKFTVSSTGEILRRILVGTQYFIAALLISGVLLIFNQVRFIKNKDIGFDRRNLINIQIPSDTIVNYHMDVYIDAIKASPRVISTSLAHVNLHGEGNMFTPTLQNPDGTQFQISTGTMLAGPEFFKTTGAEIMIGRTFNHTIADYDGAVIINEAAMKKFGWDKDPLSAKFIGWTPQEVSRHDVIGVVKDFHLGVSYNVVQPMIIFASQSIGNESNLYVRVTSDNIKETIATLESTWKEKFPHHKLEYSFVDQDLLALYNREENFIKLLLSLCVVIVVIASMGMIGLISYTTELRRKEIAIRKILGSSFGHIGAMLTQKFMFLLIIANLLAIPATLYLIDLWLSNFAYRADVSPITFVASFVACILFTGLSIGFHTARAALANPVDALKYE